jgi:hypothetical protein
MSTIIERQIDPTTGSLGAPASSWKRRIRAGEVEQRFTHGRSKAIAVEGKRRALPIRAWRAPEADAMAATRPPANRSSVKLWGLHQTRSQEARGRGRLETGESATGRIGDLGATAHRGGQREAGRTRGRCDPARESRQDHR